MNLCSSNHEEVCYESRTCPACAIREELQSKLDELDKEVAGLRDEIEDLTNQQ